MTVAVEEIRFASLDGVVLEGELASATDAAPATAAVLCHPHPQYGGSMRAGIIGDLFRALPAAGVTTLRFNFRGVERSEGHWDEGRAERGDVAAAVDTLAAVTPDLPLALVGWSFGADMALSVHDPRVRGWCAIAPPLHSATGLDETGTDPRPKHLVLGERDDVVPVDRVLAATAEWIATTHDVVPGASHFFVGASDAVVAAVIACCAQAVWPPRRRSRP
jgi:alpha/beta superfamily hydrolase